MSEEQRGFWGEVWHRLRKWAVGWARGGPHFVIGYPGRPYLLRWYVLPRNPVLNVYLHKFVRDDDDRALHDHPWPSLSVLLKGWYIEVTEEERFGRRVEVHSPYFAGAVRLRSATFRHRIMLPHGRPAWTLFFTGPVLREWGFWCRSEGGTERFVPHQEFTKPGNPGEVGAGCGEGAGA